ncbi:MAG: phenylalanine--tRNA ligase subunit alpha [Bradymonadales bacterium]|nr:phenylalanine--tRNA ligase subunit alpha [Bradymonadales bacterium]
MNDSLDARIESLATLAEEARKEFATATHEEQLNQLKARYLGKSGSLKTIMESLKELSPDQRPILGKTVNQTKQEVLQALEDRRVQIREEKRRQELAHRWIDLSLPGRQRDQGAIHPLRSVTRELFSIFRSLGYDVAEGPCVEDDFHNFSALNFPPDHPARDMQDTLLLKNGALLRTHTSPVQIRTMQANRPPIRIIAPGMVYRCDADVSHSPMFSQIEGLWVDEKVSLADLKGTLTTFARRYYGPDVPIRLRPSFFPFTEPSCEVDVGCVFCPRGGSCSVCHDTGWIEILGAGMVDPNVFEAVGYDPEKVQGFAFGLGIERVAMLKYGINDIRLLFENDVRFLRQFAK